MTDKDIQLLTSKLDTIIKIMALQTIEGKNQAEAAWLLSLSGLQNKEIAEILGTTPDTVKVSLYKMRKKNNAKTKDGNNILDSPGIFW